MLWHYLVEYQVDLQHEQLLISFDCELVEVTVIHRVARCPGFDMFVKKKKNNSGI